MFDVAVATDAALEVEAVSEVRAGLDCSGGDQLLAEGIDLALVLIPPSDALQDDLAMLLGGGDEAALNVPRQ